MLVNLGDWPPEELRLLLLRIEAELGTGLGPRLAWPQGVSWPRPEVRCRVPPRSDITVRRLSRSSKPRAMIPASVCPRSKVWPSSWRTLPRVVATQPPTVPRYPLSSISRVESTWVWSHSRDWTLGTNDDQGDMVRVHMMIMVTWSEYI